MYQLNMFSLCRWLYIYYFFIVEINLLFNILITEKEMIGFTKNLSYRVTQAKQIVIEYEDLVGKKNLKSVIEEAYGSKGKDYIIKGWAFFLLMEYLITHNKGKPLCLSSTD